MDTDPDDGKMETETAAAVSEEVAPRALPDLRPTIDDYGREPVIRAIAEATGEIPHSYSETLGKAAKNLRRIGDDQSADAVEFLACSMQAMLDASDVRRPFKPMFVFGDRRGLIPDDFEQDQINVIADLAGQVSDSALKARLSDIAWLRKRSPDFAEMAVTAYLEAAERLLAVTADEERHLMVPALEYIERAVRLSLLVFQEPEKLAPSREALLAFGPSLYAKGELGRVLSAEELIFKLRLADIGERVEFVEELAGFAEKEANPHLARDLWLFAAMLQRHLSNVESEKAARIKAAEIMVALAQQVASSEQPSFMGAAAHLSNALKIYRQVPGETARKEELRVILSEYQTKLRSEMASFSTELDLTEFATKARQGVSGKTLPAALVTLAFGSPPSNQSQLKKQVYEQADKFPLQYLMDISVSDNDGRIVEVIPSLISPKDEAEKAKALRYHMMRHADIGYTIVSGGLIEPARTKILEEHFISPEVILPLAEQSLFVPEGHERLFAKGLAAGLEGDYATALHILVPQLENALREILKRQGHLVNTKEKDDQITQEVVTLGAILAHEAVADVLGTDMQFDLEALLSDKLGMGCRHGIAHGRYGDGFYHAGSHAPYIFWLILRLVIAPLIPADKKG